MKIHLIHIALMAGLAATGANAQSAAPSGSPADSAAKANSALQPDDSKRAQAYTQFMLGHLAEQEFNETGEKRYADQAISDYQKALQSDRDPAIIERLAEVYAAMQRTDDAIREAESALSQDPNNVSAHRLLARIYVHKLGESQASDEQKQTMDSAIEQLQAVQKLDPSDTQSQLWLAHLYSYVNQPGEAETVLRAILSHSPDNEGALEQLSQLYLSQGRASDAVSVLKDAAGVNNDAGLYDMLGNAYAKVNDNQKAAEAYTKAMTLEPDDASHRRGLAQALLSEDKFQEALEQYQHLTQMEPDNAQNYLRMSQIYRHLGQFDKSESNLMQAKKFAPGNLEVLYNEALLYEAQARYADAIQVLTNAIAGVKAQQQEGQRAPNALGILYEQLGMAYRSAGDFPLAEQTFEDMGELGPDTQKRSELLLLDTYRASGDIKRAIQEAQKSSKADPTDRDLAVTYAMLLGDDSQTNDAVKVLHGLLRSNASDREIYLDLAQVEQRGHHYAEAEQDANAALKMSQQTSDQESVWFLLGAIYDSQKRYDEAEQMFRKSLSVEPHDAMVLNYYGYMLADRGLRLDEAVSMVRSAVASDPTNGAYLDSLGWAYFKQGKLPEAQQYLEQAVAHSIGDPTILGHLGEVYAKLGQSDRAEKTWEKALAQWQKALPADYEADKVSSLESKLRDLKLRLAQKSPGAENKPQ
ncbi:MAG TPA: tetratricopeptide repeat protein [Candidatus Acidoferrales bacterium]|nr:tetratricopeptide repeat protein [Candidatus Acidoferrales bacterium]